MQLFCFNNAFIYVKFSENLVEDILEHYSIVLIVTKF